MLQDTALPKTTFRKYALVHSGRKDQIWAKYSMNGRFFIMNCKVMLKIRYTYTGCFNTCSSGFTLFKDFRSQFPLSSMSLKNHENLV